MSQKKDLYKVLSKALDDSTLFEFEKLEVLKFLLVSFALGKQECEAEKFGQNISLLFSQLEMLHELGEDE